LVVAPDASGLTWPRRQCVKTGWPPGAPSSFRHRWPSVCSSRGATQHSSRSASELPRSVQAWLDAMCSTGTPREGRSTLGWGHEFGCLQPQFLTFHARRGGLPVIPILALQLVPILRLAGYWVTLSLGVLFAL
jgi:hypothetical protein